MNLEQAKTIILSKKNSFTSDFVWCLENIILRGNDDLAESMRCFLLNGTMWDSNHKNYTQFIEDLKNLKEIVNEDKDAVKYINGYLNRDIMVLNNI